MKNYLTLAWLSLILCFATACARLGSPPGGPEDKTAPIVKESKPANYSTNYSQKKVQITFDEFVVLDKIQNEFILSPPLEKKPLPQLRGKSIVVELPASELDSFTYTLDFGQAIKDNNEGNPLPNYQFILSKTDYIDSFSVSGKLVDNFTLKPNKDAFIVCLYKNLADTSPVKSIPSYLARTNPQGEFSINHIGPGTYKVFALEDANNNMKYDLPTENIAFLDLPVTILPDSFPKTTFPEIKSDTVLPADSLHKSVSKYYVEKDTASRNDSTRLKLYGFAVNLYSFIPEEPFQQYLKDYTRTSPEKFTLYFNESLENPVKIRLLNPIFQENWYHSEPNKTMDTLVYWLTDSILIKNDSIVVEITHPYTDSTSALISLTDTLLLKSKEIKKDENKRENRIGENLLKLDKKDKEEKSDTLPKPPPRMQLTNNINTANHDLNVPIWIIAEAPVKEYHPELIKLTRMEDTVEVASKFTITKDTANSRRFRIDITFEPGTSYNLKLFEGAFRDIYSRTMDTTVFSFTTQRDDYYGTVKIKMTHINGPTIIQLLDKEEKKIIRQLSIGDDQTVDLRFLAPGFYKYKIIYDSNQNGKWDTGDYNTKRQPEKVLYFPKDIEIKSNWDVEYEWEIIE